MKNTIIFIVLFLSFTEIQSQEYIFDENYGAEGILIHEEFGGKLNVGKSILLGDGSLLIFGRNDTQGLRIQMLKILPSGELDLSFGTEGIGDFLANVTCNNAAIQSDGKIVGVGYRSQNGTRKVSAFRINANGTWDDTFGDNGSVVIEGAYTSAVDVLVDQSDAIYLTDNRNLIKLTSDGMLDASFGSNGIATNNDGIISLSQKADGTILIGGVYFTPLFETKIYFQEIGPNGGFVGDQIKYDSPSTGDEISFLKVMEDGKVIIGGSSIIDGIKQGVLVGFNTDDELMFSQVLDLQDTNKITDVVKHPDGSFTCIGSSFSNFRYTAYLSKFDASGNLVRTQEFDDIKLREILGDQAVASCHMLADNTLWLTGTAEENLLNVNFYSAKIIETNMVSSISRVRSLEEISISPNPTTSNFNICFSLAKDQNLEIQLLDLQGRLMKVVSKNQFYQKGEHNLEVNASLSTGSYLLSLLNSKGEQVTQKIQIIQ